MKTLNLPLTHKEIKELHAGDSVLLNGVILTARDCAHRRIKDIMQNGEIMPFELQDAYIYYAGPCPAKPGMASGSCGPTTSSRMDSFAPDLLDAGLGGIIGKGEMSEEVRNAVVRNGRIYFAAIGGAGALYATAIKKSECIAFHDLLSEGIFRLEIENFPVVVAFDSYGNSIYD